MINTNGGTQVIMPVEKYEALKAAWDAVNENRDLYISKGMYYVAYILKTESEVISKLKNEIIELQDQIKELEKSKKTWFK